MTNLVDRLRDNSTLAICPFDRRSPEYWSTPNDKPCKFCGSEPDGPDKCTGADTRVLMEAADRIEELERQLARFRSDRSYIIGFNDGWSSAVEEAAKIADEYECHLLSYGGSVDAQHFYEGGMLDAGQGIAEAIRALSDSSPTLMQEQKEGE